MKVTFSFSKPSWVHFPTQWLKYGRGVLVLPLLEGKLLRVHLLCTPVLNLTSAQRREVLRAGVARIEEMLQPLLLVSHSCVVYSAEVTGSAPAVISIHLSPNMVSRQKNSDLIILYFLNYERLEGRATP